MAFMVRSCISSQRARTCAGFIDGGPLPARQLAPPHGDGEDSGDEGDDEMDDGMDGASSTAMDVAAEGGKRSAADAFGDGEESEMSTAVATATPAMGAMEVETGGETEAIDGTSTDGEAKKKKRKKRGGRGKTSSANYVKQHRWRDR
jgi:hypothetical protein